MTAIVVVTPTGNVKHLALLIRVKVCPLCVHVSYTPGGGGGGATPRVWAPATPPPLTVGGGPLKGGGGRFWEWFWCLWTIGRLWRPWTPEAGTFDN